MADVAIEREAIALFEAMLDVPEAERERLVAARTGGRPRLATRLRAMLDADRLAALSTGGAGAMIEEEEEEEAPPERIGAYRITGRIGRGGMGSVYRGERDTGDFTHLVAIKVIKPGLLGDALVDRFTRERQTLARLTHPNIAQLYDGGQTEHGSPYIVMEYVDGLPLMQWVERQRPSRAERQRLFLDICGAVGFAHRGLIVHRDLTPANVLVTREGVVKLIDFGIAKPPDDPPDDPAGPRDEGPATAALSHTPGFAAPERLSSRAVTTAADIYSLGRLLERLVAPAAGDRELGAIVARATAADPLARYATAEALSADVVAWRDGFPVAAVGGGRRYAAGKFVGRYRLAVGAAAAAIVLLIAAFSLTLVANVRAEAARRDAVGRFEQTRGIAKALLFDAYDAVSRVPGSTGARATLAHTGLAYLEALAADPEVPVDVRVEAGRGFVRLAQVMGGGQAGQLGRYEDANALLARAEEILGPLYRGHPEDPGVRRAMAALRVEQSGTNLYSNNEPAVARRQALEAQALLGAVARDDAESARIVATAIQAEGDSHGWDDAYAPARDAHRRAEAFIAGLPPALRDERGVMSARSANLRLLGEAHHKLHEHEPARLALEQAVELNRALVRAAPDDPTAVRKLALSLWYSAVVHRTNERDEQARSASAEAVAYARMLRERDPNDAGALSLFATTGELDAQVLADGGRFEDSFARGDEVAAAHRRLVELAGNTPGALRSMATSLSTRGGNFYNGRAYDRACATWRQTLAIFVDLERSGDLTETDRGNGLPEVREYLRRACEGGPPRAGLGPAI